MEYVGRSSSLILFPLFAKRKEGEESSQSLAWDCWWQSHAVTLRASPPRLGGHPLPVALLLLFPSLRCFVCPALLLFCCRSPSVTTAH